MGTVRLGRLAVAGLAAAVAFAGTACGVHTAGGGEGHTSLVLGGVRTFPYGEVYTAPAHLSSEAEMTVGYTDSPIQITFRVNAQVVPSGNFYAQHDFDTTTWLGNGARYTHKGQYQVYDRTGSYEMVAKAVSCLYRDGSPCTVGANMADSFIFDVVEGFRSGSAEVAGS